MKNYFIVLTIFIILFNVGCKTDNSPINSQDHIFYRDSNNDIQHIIQEKEEFKTDNWMEKSKAPKAAGDPTAIFANGLVNIFYRDSANNIQRIIRKNNEFKSDNWTEKSKAPKASGDPAAMFSNGLKYIFYRDSTNNIQYIIQEKEAFRTGNLTELAKAPKSFSNPAVMITESGNHIFYRDNINNIQHIIWNNEEYTTNNWTKLAKATKAVGDPAAMLVDNKNQEHVFFQGDDNNIQHIILEKNKEKFRSDCWTKLANRWTQMAGAPKAAGSPSAIFSNEKEHVFYRDIDNNIQHLYFDNGKFKTKNLTNLAKASKSFGDPTVITVPINTKTIN